MRLRHIFENQTDVRIKSEKHALDLLEPWFTIDSNNLYSTGKIEVIIKEDKVHLFYGDITQKSNVKLDRMPFEIDTFIGHLTLSDIKNLDNLPKTVSSLMFNGYQQTDFSGMENIVIRYLNISNCANLTSLNGLKHNGNGAQIRIFNCEQLAFDPWVYEDNYRFVFDRSLPRNVKLVQLVCLSKYVDLLTFPWNMPQELKKIINKYQGKYAAMPHMALELVRAGYGHHVR